MEREVSYTPTKELLAPKEKTGLEGPPNGAWTLEKEDKYFSPEGSGTTPESLGRNGQQPKWVGGHELITEIYPVSEKEVCLK